MWCAPTYRPGNFLLYSCAYITEYMPAVDLLVVLLQIMVTFSIIATPVTLCKGWQSGSNIPPWQVSMACIRQYVERVKDRACFAYEYGN